MATKKGSNTLSGRAHACALLLAFAASGCFLPRNGIVVGDDGDGGTECVPSAELCDGIDNDCDPATPDGAGDPALNDACETDEDEDQCEDDVLACADGVMTCADDGAVLAELCGGGDEDCDGAIDETGTPWFADNDGDGYGAGAPVLACDPPPAHVAMDGDCDDASAAVSPASTEICDGVDQNCDDSPDDTACGCPSVAVDGRAYLFCSIPIHWSEANARCSSRGYALARPESIAESRAVGAALPSGDPWWIGVLHSSGKWRWLDTTEITDPHWASGEGTATAGEGCGALLASGEWADRPCSAALNYVCER